MDLKVKNEVVEVLREAMKELESQKGSVLSGVQKLARVAQIINNEKIYIWCQIQLGNCDYTDPLGRLIEEFKSKVNDNGNIKEEEILILHKKVEELGLTASEHFTLEEIKIKHIKSGGGFKGIGFIEEKYYDLVRRKVGNDGTYYKTSLNEHINYVRRVAHSKTSSLYNEIILTDIPQSIFDVLRSEVDDKLLDLNPELAEQLMIAFKCISSNNAEEWSQALTTCRRFIEKLADTLYPSTDVEKGTRKLGQTQYINRLWAFMDESIESQSNRDVAKVHVDYLGGYLQKVHKISNKGVHNKLTKIEAIKTVFHTYLIVADFLEYINADLVKTDEMLNIYTASIDELQSFLDISKNSAKEIIKLRVKNSELQPHDLEIIAGIGKKTIQKAESLFSFDKID